jgi:nucleotide-binding universal stress UspA family protein
MQEPAVERVSGAGGVPPDVSPAPRLDLVTFVKDVQESALKLVTAVVEEVVGDDPAIDVMVRALEGPAVSVLIDAARGADLLVLGSRGLGGFTGLLVGSVSQQCIQHAPCPVTIHRSAHQ